ncbi:MAG: DUF1998 domain-containing protein [Planctomycetes bacterium]|nr:DUF1998 domain-containing protein [Planctomycetota bacterium]
MSQKNSVSRVGDIRQSQLLFSYGVGAIIDLPHLSVMVMGLDDWNTQMLSMEELNEERLRNAVRAVLGNQVERLMLPPVPKRRLGLTSVFDEDENVGVPVASFPRWLRCPACDYLGPISSNLFELKKEPFHTDRIRYAHGNCSKGGVRARAAVPARFLVGCRAGHLDDFPWRNFVHRDSIPCKASIRLSEFGVSGEAAHVEVRCDNCNANRRMSDAFGREAKLNLPPCTGRNPHLRETTETPCTEEMVTLLIGASNSWFPLTLSVLNLPADNDPLGDSIIQNWAVFQNITSKEILRAFRGANMLRGLEIQSDDAIWKTIQEHRRRLAGGESETVTTDLKGPEWEMLSNPDARKLSDEFRCEDADIPPAFRRQISRLVQVERMREVRALIGFTRIDSPGDYSNMDEMPDDRRASLSRNAPHWVPAGEVRGEGIFIQFSESALSNWEQKRSIGERSKLLFQAHRRWRIARSIENPDLGFPDVRYTLLHTLSHTLMRQLAIECGYTSASIRERIYSSFPGKNREPMAGILIYTAAPDSEGTLGGLVSLGETKQFERLLTQALEEAKLCSSDPLCAEHAPEDDGLTLHGAACHACLFAPETSCERGNRYLDRTLLIPTLVDEKCSFFDISR